MSEPDVIQIDELPDLPETTDDTMLHAKQAGNDFNVKLEQIRDYIVDPLADTILEEITPEIEAAAEAAVEARVDDILDEYEDVLGAIEKREADDPTAFSVEDERGRVVGALSDSGELRTTKFAIEEIDGVEDIVFVDRRDRMMRLGEIISRIGSGGGGSIGGGDTFSDAEIAGLDGQALGARDAVVSNGNASLQQFIAGNNHALQYGQSFSVGALGHPPRTLAQLYDARMVGDSIRSADGGNTYTPYGGSSVFKNFKVTVEGPDSGYAILNDAQIAALDHGTDPDFPYDTARGETALAGFADSAKFYYNQLRNGGVNDANKRFVLSSTGLGGASIESLMDPAVGRYMRTIDVSNKIKALSDAETKASRLAYVQWEQGQHNAAHTSNSGAGTPRADYYNKMMTLRANIHNDIAVGIYGQTLKAPWLMAQTSGKWTYDDELDHGVAMAQLDANLNTNDMFVAFPEYFITNNLDGHPDANGYRWMGMMFGKVWHKVSVLGQGWRPLHITKALKRKQQILLCYHVPVPPLTFRDYYNIYTAMNSDQRGFRVFDGGGELIPSVEIKGNCCILLTVTRPLTGNVKVTYADATGFLGGGNVFDSDASVAVRNYEYRADANDLPAVNVPALVNKPYPLNNPACQQVVTAVAG